MRNGEYPLSFDAVTGAVQTTPTQHDKEVYTRKLSTSKLQSIVEPHPHITSSNQSASSIYTWHELGISALEFECPKENVNL